MNPGCADTSWSLTALGSVRPATRAKVADAEACTLALALYRIVRFFPVTRHRLTPSCAAARSDLGARIALDHREFSR